MDRRTFVLLTGGVSSGLIRPPSTALHRPPPRGVAGAGRLRFELDDHRRWSLWYYGDGSPVPVVRGAEIVAWVGDQPLTLAELEDSTVGSRRPPGGDAVVVRGRAAGVWVEAELLTAGGASTPQASVTVTVFPDRYLPTVRGVRFFQLPHADVLAGEGPLTALVNGAHSADPTRVVTVGAPEAEGLASHAAVGLTRGSRGLAIAFDAGEPGEARVQLSRDALEAVSDWLPARPLRPEGDASHMRLCFHPEGDGLEALRALFVPSARGIRTPGSRTATPGSPTRFTRAASRRACGSRRSAWPRPPVSPPRSPTGYCAMRPDPSYVRRAKPGVARSTRSTAPTPRCSSGCSIWPAASCENGATTTCASTGCAGRPSA